MILGQIDEFTFNDIFDIIKHNSEVGVSTGLLIEVVDNAFEFCLNEEYIEIYDHQSYIVNINKQNEIEDLLNEDKTEEQVL